ncbi:MULTISPECIES: undecaprenyldiphospho-muramoylpentapeptide beta-N-acetylglucosaminyltransferase [Gammaproteobacteria]|uniref:undecaprenyldiphospho-muramoylpentapeptide beta-N-acetylglucosaminyltransferase n=1 Tax=Gammaproteobacteria TaxID=1236 RepID=UPI000DD0C6EE|nr:MULTISPECIES: undecaprenyldiphospho-muramoylpentapeptide beta-N-acetylglucosaminyltransferase [Gammaproteobacteria]RTE86317.1 undecaprenyldiphospho-muramoylpentapeptide beta-N-acetylglucosaminyltransferase [Aliidiomarina sp. B3213]TCZ91667.1 undecaprenyldiphospho-muramoylpentapeptide beta-N-acetylglucosaminyltransferase [Lysobacter sp. N42]
MKHVLITAGGTGGHVFPALAVAQELKDAGFTISWLGTEDRMEAQVVPKAGFDFTGIEQKAVRGKGALGWLIAPFRLLAGVIKMRRFLALKKPDLVLGFGGYTAGPAGVAAKSKGIPLIIHEQNAAAGMTNKLLAPLSARVLLGFRGASEQLKRSEWVGNPVRQDIAHLMQEAVPLPEIELKILVVGGSLGAQHLNEVMPEVLSQWTGGKVSVLHQTGKGKREQVLTAYSAIDNDTVKSEVVEFIEDMKAAYLNANLVVCRAGALTCSELACVGRASLLVPYPYAVDDHQTKNAGELVSAGAARLIKQHEFTCAHVTQVLQELSAHPEQVKEMGEHARQIAQPDAAAKVAAICAEEMNTEMNVEQH